MGTSTACPPRSANRRRRPRSRDSGGIKTIWIIASAFIFPREVAQCPDYWSAVIFRNQKANSNFEVFVSFKFFFNSINQSTWWVTIEKATVMSFNFQTKGRPDNWTATTRLLDRFEISEAWPVTWTSGIGSYCSQSWTGRWEDSDLPSLHQAVRHRLPLSWLGYFFRAD